MINRSVYIDCPVCSESIEVEYSKSIDQRTLKCDCCETYICANISIEVYPMPNPFENEDRREAV